ncbi:MAG: tetratricopeptide repeat-containing glycosyltransferase family protein, partial [Gemmatimonadaceae bacterium]
ARQNQNIHPQAVVAIANGRKALDAGRFELAVKAFRKAVTLAPKQSAIHYALGLACIKAQRPLEAIAPMRCARDLAPGDYDCQLGLADAYYLSQQLAHALPEYLRAGSLDHQAVLPWSNAGALYRETGRPELALAALAKALTIDPTHAGALCNSALALHDLGEFAAARDSVELALQSRPDYPEAYWNRALLDLLNGDFARGWAGHEFRTVQLAKQGGLRMFAQPRWTGERFDGKRLLLWPEQGLGDQLQFVRFLPRVKQLGGTVVLACSAPLLPLFRANCPDADEIVVIGEVFGPVDLQLPLMSIPYVLQLKSNVDGDRVPYLRANDDIRVGLDDALPANQSNANAPLRVGIAWAGQPKHVNDRNRSLTLEALRPLLSVPNVEWYSLQKGDASEAQVEPFNLASRELKQPSVTALGPVLANFNDTAHAVERLDLVISVDTSVAHLAGAMNVPVWMLIPFVPDWRWQVKRTDSPWYPSARLFRQSRAGDWVSLMVRVASALEGQSRAKDDRAVQTVVSTRAA